jgi:hypothetical protein
VAEIRWRGKGGTRSAGVGEGRGGAAIAGDRKLTGVRENRPTTHGFEMREYRDDAGEMANPMEHISRVGMVLRGARHERRRA